MKAPKISIQIGADTRRLKKDMKRADGIVGKFTTAAKFGLAGVATAAGAAAFSIGKEGVQAAIADQASQVKLATALENTTKATQDQIKANEEYITQTQLRYGVEDVLLRNSLGKLATVTGSLTKAQEMQGVALDVAAGAGISLEAATTLVTKALQGSFTGFKKLGIVLDENITKNKDGAAAVEVLGAKYEGAAIKAADTTAGKLQRINQAWDETIEGVGEVLLPYLEDVSDWATSPEGAQALNDFIVNFRKGIEATITAVQTLGEWLDNITPDPGTWMSNALYGQRGSTPAQQQGIQIAQRAATSQYLANTNRFVAQDPRSVTINISGAIDPVSTARQIQKLLNQVPRQPISVDISKRSK